MRVRLPRLLNAQMQERERLNPSRVGILLNLNSPHTADMEIPPSETAPGLREWVELYTVHGSAGKFRVSSVDDTVGQQVRLRLKHGLCVLNDDVVKLGDEPITDTAGGLLQRFWSAASVTETPKYWTLGTLAQTPQIEYTPNGEKLLQAVQAVLKKTNGYALTFDQSVFPWVMNLVQLSESDACEGRFSRNMDGVDISVDDSEQCTRVYLDDRAGYTDADNISEWGVISETLTVPENATDASIALYVNDYLQAHKEPSVSIELEGVDLSAITGESLDSFRTGRICRACLTDYGATVKERIVALEYPDVYGDPEGVRVSMANRRDTTSDLLKTVKNDTASLSRGATVTSRRVGGVSSRVEINEIELYKAQEEIAYLDDYTRLTFNEVYVDLDEINAELVLKASQTVTDELGRRVSSAEIKLDGAEAEIDLKVDKNGVISAINVSSESITIQSSRINLSGYVTASQFSAEVASINQFFSGNATAAKMVVTNLTALSLTFAGNEVKWSSKEVVTSVSCRASGEIVVRDADGNIAGTAITGISFSRNTDMIYYMTW